MNHCLTESLNKIDLVPRISTFSNSLYNFLDELKTIRADSIDIVDNRILLPLNTISKTNEYPSNKLIMSP